MCEVIVVVVDTVNPDPVLDSMCYKSGDVICVQPDGWGWGHRDNDNPNWRIFKFPGLAPSLFAGFIKDQSETNPGVNSQTFLRRAWKIDFTLLAQAPSLPPGQASNVAPYIADGTRANGFITLPLAAGDIAGFTVVKPLTPNPNVLGATVTQPVNVIG